MNGGEGDLRSTIGEPHGTLGLWTVKKPRHGPPVWSEDTFPLTQHAPTTPKRTDTAIERMHRLQKRATSALDNIGLI